LDIFDRLANLFKSFVNDVSSDDDNTSGQSRRQFVDPDEQAAWEELNDYLNNDEPKEHKSHTYHQGQYSSHQTNTNKTDPVLQQDFKNLEVPFGSPFEKVKESYKKLIRQYHPDIHANNPEKLKYATEFTKKLNESFLRIKKHYNKT